MLNRAKRLPVICRPFASYLPEAEYSLPFHAILPRRCFQAEDTIIAAYKGAAIP